jgi:hypothetical protein
MAIRDTSSMSCRPIRELVCPHIDEPVGAGQAGDERRRSYRYARRLPGTLVVDGMEHPVTCIDIGYGGMRVLVSGRMSLPVGERVVVRIRQSSQLYQDQLSVVKCKPAADETMIHLHL